MPSGNRLLLFFFIFFSKPYHCPRGPMARRTVNQTIRQTTNVVAYYGK